MTPAKGRLITTYVAMLRGINVSGRNRVPMAELRSLVEGLGFDHVQTYVQSGNAVFDGSGNPSKVGASIHAAIATTFGFEVPVVVRTKAQLDQVVAANPFAAEGGDPGSQPTLFHVSFLATAPDPVHVATFMEAAEPYAPDVCRVVGTEVYLHIPGGYGNTKLHNAWVERKLSTVATTRNWRSVLALADMAGGPAAD